VSPTRIALLISLLAVATHPLPAQAPANHPPAALASPRLMKPPSPCDPFAMFFAVPSKPVLLTSPSPSDPGYGSKHELLLNKLVGQIIRGGGVMVGQYNGPVCPLSLEAPAPPLPFQVNRRAIGEDHAVRHESPQMELPHSALDPRPIPHLPHPLFHRAKRPQTLFASTN